MDRRLRVVRPRPVRSHPKRFSGESERLPAITKPAAGKPKRMIAENSSCDAGPEANGLLLVASVFGPVNRLWQLDLARREVVSLLRYGSP